MNKAVKMDLSAVQEAMEDLLKLLPTMTLKTKVDVAARLRAVAKSVDAIDEQVKKEIKGQFKDNEPGVVSGEVFKSIVTLVETTRLNQKKLEVDFPKTYAKCLETKPQARVTFEPR